MSDNVRAIVLETLYELETTDKLSHLCIRAVLDKYDYWSLRDKAFYKKVTEGAVSRKLTLDYIADLYSGKKMEKCKPMIRCLLRMSIYQLVFMDKVPDNAIVDEAVKLCKKYSRSEFAGFVNKILRVIAANKCEWKEKAAGEERIKRLSIMHSMPEWLVRMLVKEQDSYETLLPSLNEKNGVSVFFFNENDGKYYTELWRNKQIDFCRSDMVDNAYVLTNCENPALLDGFAEGKFIIQDLSSMIMCEALRTAGSSNLVISDVCAAPGGKTCHVAGTLGGNCVIYSRDVSDKKIELIQENVTRLNLDNVVISVNDATVVDDKLVGKCDIVIADVPCSGLGVLGRKSDIRYHISNESMMEICHLQKEIIKVVSSYVKPGGILVYSTCTIHKAENEKMVKYITDNFGFEPVSLKGRIKDSILDRHDEFMIQLRPDIDNTDGFFFCLLRKKA